MNERARAQVKSEITSYNKRKKRVLFHGSHVAHKGSPTSPREGEALAVVKVANGITLAMGYQSVRLDVGVEMPVAVRPGHFKDLANHFDRACRYVDRELSERSKELDELLRDLARKYGDR